MPMQLQKINLHNLWVILIENDEKIYFFIYKKKFNLQFPYCYCCFFIIINFIYFIYFFLIFIIFFQSLFSTTCSHLILDSVTLSSMLLNFQLFQLLLLTNFLKCFLLLLLIHLRTHQPFFLLLTKSYFSFFLIILLKTLYIFKRN